jgi:hypothetical protein
MIIETEKYIDDEIATQISCLYFTIEFNDKPDRGKLWPSYRTRWHYRRASVALDKLIALVFKCLYFKYFRIHKKKNHIRGSARSDN